MAAGLALRYEDKRLVDEGTDQVDRIPVALLHGSNALGRLQREAVDEDGQSPKQSAFFLRQQVVAPVNGCPERLMVWRCGSAAGAEHAETIVETSRDLDVCVAERVKLVVFHMNVPPRQWVDQLHAAGCRVWQQAASVDQAVEAAEAAEVGIDAVIAQGRQAGGHNKSVTRTIPLLRQVIREVHPLMVIAAGGIATGADVAIALMNGAEGVWVGTRMVASTEAFAHPDYKRRLLEAHGHATAVTTAFGPEYPNVPYRVLRTELVRQVAGHKNEIGPTQPVEAPIGETILFPFTLRVPYAMPPFSAIVPTPDTTGTFDLMGFPAGEESVRKLKDIRPAADIIEEMMGDARELLRTAL